MSNSKHTPGPWDIESNGPTSIGGKPLVIVDGGRILTYGIDGEEGIYAHSVADVLLMNAAPELLAACERAERMAIRNLDDAEIYRTIRSALNKARGLT